MNENNKSIDWKILVIALMDWVEKADKIKDDDGLKLAFFQWVEPGVREHIARQYYNLYKNSGDILGFWGYLDLENQRRLVKHLFTERYLTLFGVSVGMVQLQIETVRSFKMSLSLTDFIRIYGAADGTNLWGDAHADGGSMNAWYVFTLGMNNVDGISTDDDGFIYDGVWGKTCSWLNDRFLVLLAKCALEGYGLGQ